jgi:Chaperone of endosialidase
MKKPIRLFLTFLCLSVAGHKAIAVDPPPGGGYPGGNTAAGDNALLSLTTGLYNTAVGFYSLASDTTGQLNTAIGAGTLLFNIGDQNTAAGAGALFNNTTGDANTATGAFALGNNTTGVNNTAHGNRVLVSNTTGHDNTAVGSSALYSNETGNYNVAVGPDALKNNINGQLNTAMNVQALFLNTSGSQNVAVGMQALLVNTTGNENTAVGTQALGFNATGIRNTALGTRAGQNLTTGDYNIDIGAQTKGIAGESGTTRIGTAPFHTRAFVAGIRGVTTENNDAVPVVIDSAGQLGTVSSSRRYKTDIQPIEQASESILALKPVTFRYKVHKDTMPNFGLIAEDVAKINPDLVIYDADGNPFTVRYDAVNAMFLNEFLKEHCVVQEQKATIAELKHGFAQQQKQIEALTAGLQKVSAQVELSKPAPQTVLNTE